MIVSTKTPTVYLPPTEKRPQKESQEQWQNFINTPEKRDWLLFVGQHYTNVLNVAKFDCLLLKDYDPDELIYLIDFDVLRSFLEGQSARERDTVIFGHLFYISKQRYALPVGAFRELLEWLSRYGNFSDKLLDSAQITENLSPKNFIKKIGSLLNISVKDSTKAEDIIVNKIVENLDTKMQVLNKLVHFLTNERFVGIVSEHEKADIDIVSKILPNIPRPHMEGKPRTRIDQRDSINLSIAFKSYREQKTKSNKGSSTSYVLITQTTSLHRLPEFLEEIDYDSVGFEPEDALCKLLDIKGQLSNGNYPVLSPARIVHAEKMGIFEQPHTALLQVRSLHENFSNITNVLFDEKMMDNSIEAGSVQEQALEKFLQTERDKIRGYLETIAEVITVNNTGILHKLESRRISGVLQDYSNKKLRNVPLSRSDEVRIMSLGFLELFDLVCLTLEEVPGFDYEPELETKALGIEACKIFQKPNLSSDHPAIWGEIYPALNSQDAFYVFRWHIGCTENRFIDALKELIKPYLLDNSAKTNNESYTLDFSLEPVSEDSAFWDEGIVVYSEHGIFGNSLKNFLNKSWDYLNYENISIALGEALRRFKLIPKDQTNVDLGLEQIRLNTYFGDCIFEVVPNIHQEGCCIHFISHLNFSPQIARFYANTSGRITSESKLIDAINIRLSNFQEPKIKSGEKG